MDYFRAWYEVNAAVLWLESLVLVLVLLGIATFLWRRLRAVEARYEQLMTDASGNSLREMLEDHVRRVRGTLDRVDALENLTHDLEHKLGYSVQWVGLVRYNPFRDTGGDQSFAIALADDHGDGLVLSSLHRRDITRVYAKPLLSWESTHPLTEEELQAIEEAQRHHA